MKEGSELITKSQIKKIWVEAKIFGFDKDAVYDTIYQSFEKEHLSELTKEEASNYIDALVRANNKANSNQREGMMTDSQKWKIEDYRIKLGWGSKELMGFIRKYAKVEHANWLTLNQASKVIEGLKNVYLRNNDEKSINTRGK